MPVTPVLIINPNKTFTFYELSDDDNSWDNLLSRVLPASSSYGPVSKPDSDTTYTVYYTLDFATSGKQDSSKVNHIGNRIVPSFILQNQPSAIPACQKVVGPIGIVKYVNGVKTNFSDEDIKWILTMKKPNYIKGLPGDNKDNEIGPTPVLLVEVNKTTHFYPYNVDYLFDDIKGNIVFELPRDDNNETVYRVYGHIEHNVEQFNTVHPLSEVVMSWNPNKNKENSSYVGTLAFVKLVNGLLANFTEDDRSFVLSLKELDESPIVITTRAIIEMNYSSELIDIDNVDQDVVVPTVVTSEEMDQPFEVVNCRSISIPAPLTVPVTPSGSALLTESVATPSEENQGWSTWSPLSAIKRYF